MVDSNSDNCEEMAIQLKGFRLTTAQIYYRPRPQISKAL